VKKIIVDLDGVLADFMLAITQLMAKEHPTVKPTRAHQQKTYVNHPDFPPGAFDKAFDWVKENAYDFNRDMESLLTQEEATYLTFIATIHEVYFVTARKGGAGALHGTQMFLRKKIGIHNPNVILTERKGEFARAIGATHAIEDKAENALSIADHSPNTKSYLLDRLYNRFDHSVVGGNVIRVSSFAEFLDEIAKK
jgi:uncharacterized HAD superfamily protein